MIVVARIPKAVAIGIGKGADIVLPGCHVVEEGDILLCQHFFHHLSGAVEQLYA